jgi:hypothetical protein
MAERTTLDFEYKDKEYSLAYTVDVIKQLDRSGLIARIMKGDLPITMTWELFNAAFEANHAKVPTRVREEIYKEFAETSEDGNLFSVLVDMLMEAQEAIKPQGNIKWRTSKKN